jgi:hypothetical protein
MWKQSWQRNLGLAVLALALVLIGTWACSGTQEGVAEEGEAVEPDKLVYEGELKIAYGKYAYIPEVQGFDVVVQGSMESGDLESMVGQTLKVEGEYAENKPSVLIADTVSVKQEDGTFLPVFTRTEEPALDDYIDLQARDAFEALEDLAYNKNETWEGKEKVKVYGTIDETDGSYKITVLDDKDKSVGSILVDTYNDFAHYYIKKLSLFDKFWFYLQVKDTVPWQTRRRTRELFHSDLLFVGLY